MTHVKLTEMSHALIKPIRNDAYDAYGHVLCFDHVHKRRRVLLADLYHVLLKCM